MKIAFQGSPRFLYHVSASVFSLSQTYWEIHKLPFSSFSVSLSHPPPCVPIKPPLCAQKCKSPLRKKLRGREQRCFLLFYSNAAFWECGEEYQTGGIYLRTQGILHSSCRWLEIKNKSGLLFAETYVLLGKWNLSLKMCISSLLVLAIWGSLSWASTGPQEAKEKRSSC